jgi:CheY-like chemotaxis protein
LRDVHVLVVDDNRDAREMLREMFGYSGAVVRAVSSGPRALAVLRSLKFDVIVSDLAMPRYDGCWLIRRVRRMSDARSRIPAIAVTAYRESQTPGEAARAGFDAYMEKPLDFRRLVETIQTLIGKRPASD